MKIEITNPIFNILAIIFALVMVIFSILNDRYWFSLAFVVALFINMYIIVGYKES